MHIFAEEQNEENEEKTAPPNMFQRLLETRTILLFG